MEFHPTMTESDAPVVKAVEDAIGSVLNTVPEKIISPGLTTRNTSPASVIHDCIAYGPGILDLAHQPDEYVVIDDMVKSSQVMALAALKLLGLESEVYF